MAMKKKQVSTRLEMNMHWRVPCNLAGVQDSEERSLQLRDRGLEEPLLMNRSCAFAMIDS